MILGATLGVLVGLAMVVHLGPGNSWLINVALAKLTLIAAGGLMGGGAVAIRLDNRERSKQLPGETDQNTD